MQEEISQELRAEIGRHITPDNYGKLDGANGIGVALDNATNSYVVMYIKRGKDSIDEIMFGTNAMSQDVPVLGSIFTDMIKEEKDLDGVEEMLCSLEKDLEKNYASLPSPEVDTSKPEGEQVQRISTEHQDSANMVLTSFRAAMRHYERKLEGIEEEYFELNIAKTCPYSLGDCHFMVETPTKEED